MTRQVENDRAMVVGWSPAAASRLKAAVKNYGAQGAVAERAGIARQSLVEILAGRSVPTNGTFLGLCAVIGVSPEAITHGSGSDGEDGVQSSEIALVPMHDVAASAGHGAAAVEAGLSPDSLGFPLQWLRRKFGDPKKLRVVHVQGDSMMPSLADGDLVMIDVGRRDRVDGIFVLRMDDQLLVKRIFFPSTRRVIVTSDNKDYDRQDRMLDLENEAQRNAFQLIGRVVWVGKAL